VAGTTTIMFTDLAASSELLATIGDQAYAAMFSGHVATLRRAVEAHRGRVAKLLGDGVQALFDSAYAGVRAAVEAQQAVELVNRRGTAPVIGMRIGIAVGEVVEATDDLFGAALVAARRLCDSAQPGQILASDIVVALVGSRTDIRFESLGMRPLKGVTEPVAITAVAWEPLPPEIPLTVIVADDATLIRSGVVRLLTDAGFVVTADVGDGDRLLAAVDANPPDLVVTDIRMPPTHTDEGLAAAAVIRERHPDVAVLVLSQYIEADLAAALLDGRPAGIGYLLKERVSDLTEFLDACRTVAAGGSIVDPAVAQRLLRRRQHDEVMTRLTGREQEVLALIAQGKSNQSVADTLVVGAKTVEGHVSQIFQKLDLEETPEGNRRVQAVLRWLQADRE
jgi:DNA-binding NarL/FixJ family response regulator/class 3 adenylate cyclase